MYVKRSKSGRYEVSVEKDTWKDGAIIHERYNWQVRDLNLGGPVILDGLEETFAAALDEAWAAVSTLTSA